MRGSTVAVLSFCLFGLVATQTSTGGWQSGRATYYGGSAQFLKNFPDRGPPPEYGFGTPLYGSCGYTSQQGTNSVDFSDVPIPVDMIAAVANINADYPGSCGRCYEVQCVTGVVTGNLTSSGTAIPYNISGGYTEPGLNYATLQDDYGRTYAGNPLKAQNELFTQCWNNTLGLTTEANSIYVQVADNCPCVQYDTTTGAETGVNAPCCGNVNHFDLSYFAFEKIAHPAYGLMNLQFRPVDCYTKQPLIFLPGYINETVYSDRVESGWSWNAYSTINKQLEVAGAGVNSANATCVDTKPQGGLTFVSRSATDSGYQPFISGNATTISFYVKQTASGSSSIGAASGATIPPSIQLGLGDDDTQYYCQGMDLSSLTKGAMDAASGMQQLTASLSSFNCDLTKVQQVGFQNVGTSNTAFCLSQLALTGGSPPSHVLAGVTASAQGDYPGAVTPLTSTASL